jgi:hypothetical protein
MQTSPQEASFGHRGQPMVQVTGPPNKALRLTAALLGAFPLAPGVPRPKRGEGETKCTSIT